MSQVLALSGGVGGAKLALGLSRVLAAEQLTIVANTADDFVHLGLPISPDLDTVMYTLAGLNNREQGWGLADESWQAMQMLRRYGAEDWFNLGDRDLATHLQRGQLLASGHTLTAATQQLAAALGVQQTLLPMSDDPVQTRLATDDGELAFQEYFVQRRCEPAVQRIFFAGIEAATPQAEFIRALADPELSAVVICPSNPFVSVRPILELAGVQDALRATTAPVIAVSPIVAGAAIKGPSAKMLAELQLPVTAAAVAELYAGLIDGFVLDQLDADSAAEIEALGMRVHCCQTVMHTLDDRTELARSVIRFADTIKD